MEKERLAKLRRACLEEGLDAFLARGTSNIFWLSCFDDVFDEERAHALLVGAHEAKLHTDSRYSEAARRAAEGAGGAIAVTDERVTHAKFTVAALAAHDARDAHGASGASDEAGMRASAPLRLGIEDDLLLREFRALEAACAEADRDVELQETSGFVERLRSVKDRNEVDRMRAAQAVTDAAFLHIVSFMKPGMAEREVQIELDDYLRRRGAQDLAFPSIVATGAHAASPHAVPGSTKLEAGQCVVMDFGAKVAGYCSDMTRTVFLGSPSARMREAYSAIRQANEQAEALLRPGVTGREAHELAERILAEHGFAGKMGHALGHGVGIDIHEDPVLAPRNETPLVAGNVVTVEPGVYLSGEFGMRLEDFGVITEQGFDVFTKSTHEMVIL